jgi:hypothetical protein
MFSCPRRNVVKVGDSVLRERLDGQVPEGFEVRRMQTQPGRPATSLDTGVRVEVATHFTGEWTDGFEVVALHGRGCQVRRLSDGTVLPVDLDYLDVRPAVAQNHRR